MTAVLCLIEIPVVDGVLHELVTGHLLVSCGFLQRHGFDLSYSIHVDAALALEWRPRDAAVLPD